jgi:ketosteroid isomerase-like protein
MTVAERLEEFYARFNRGDVDGALELMPPDVAAVDDPALPDARTYRGREEFAGGLRTLRELFEGLQVRVVSLRERGSSVVVLLEAHGRSAGAGIPVQTRLFHVFHLRDGVPAEMHVFFDEALALRDAGLESA